MPQETKQTEGNNSIADFKNIRLVESPNHIFHRRKQVIFRARMVKSDSDDSGDWISEVLTFQSPVNYLRNQSHHQFNNSRYWQSYWLVSALFGDRCGE